MHLLFPLIALCLLASTVAQTARAHTRRGTSVRQIIRRVFPDDPRAQCIAWHESTDNPSAQNGTNTGLFQIDENTWDWRTNPAAIPIVGRLDWSRMHEAAYNARAARRIYLYARRTTGNGWSPWSTASLCGA